jgi:F0F1-type ATP synthase epsilon subunit
MADPLRKNQSLSVIVKSRKEVLFEGSAYSITSYNERGFFDILPTHANFVTLIKDFVVIDKDLPSERDIKLDKGIMTVQMDKVQVYVGI